LIFFNNSNYLLESINMKFPNPNYPQVCIFRYSERNKTQLDELLNNGYGSSRSAILRNLIEQAIRSMNDKNYS